MLVQILIADLKNPPALKLPGRCVHCGKTKEETLALSFDMGVQRKNHPVEMKISVPMCKICADKERGIAKVTLVPFLIGALLFGIIAFIPATLMVPENPAPDNVNTIGFPFMVGGFVGLVVGIILGTIIEMIVKTMSIPVYGKLVTKRPLTIMSFFSNNDDLLGISGKFIKEKKIIQIEIENEEVANEFVKLNSLEKK